MVEPSQSGADKAGVYPRWSGPRLWPCNGRDEVNSDIVRAILIWRNAAARKIATYALPRADHDRPRSATRSVSRDRALADLPRSSQAAGSNDHPGAAAQIQASQHGRAAALYRAAVVVSSRALAAPAPPHARARRFGRALRGGLAIQPQPVGLSGGGLVLQSIRMAVAVRVRRLVRPRRGIASRAAPACKGDDGGRDRLYRLCLVYRLELVCAGHGPVPAALARATDLSDRQDQPRRPAVRPFSRACRRHRAVHPVQLALAQLAHPLSGDPVRPALAGDLLHRRVPGLRRALRHGGDFRCDLVAGPDQRLRYPVD